MRVLHLISSGGMYGAEAVILQLSAGMTNGDEGHSTIAVFAHKGQETPQLFEAATKAGLASELLACHGQLDLGVPGRIRELCERLRVDVLHAHGYKADLYAALAFRHKARPALVSTCHTWYDNDLALRLYGALDRWALRSFDEVVAVSTEVRQRLQDAGVPEEQIHLIENGVSVPDDPQNADPGGAGELRRLRIGLVGRLAPEKGVDIFLHAARLILAEGRNNVEFVVAGEGPERGRLEQMIKDLGLAEHVSLPGQQRQMEQFYGSIDVLVSASRQEGLPVALLEGMARGLPLVATAVGEVPQIVVGGSTGLLVKPDSPQELAAAIGSLLDDRERRRQFGLAGRARIIARFSAERMSREYLAVYRRATARRAGSRRLEAVRNGVS